MFLSRIELAPDAAHSSAFWRQVRSEYAVHQLVWSWFSGNPDARRDFLYRFEQGVGAGRFFVLSSRQPTDPEGLWRIESKPFAPKLLEGQRLRFSLRANPTLRREGKRHDVVMDARWKARSLDGEKAPTREIDEPCITWLEARGERCGFELAPGEVQVAGYHQERFGGRGRKDIRLSVVDYEGVLTVREPEAFVKALAAGIGPAKGFGCGLMLVKRA
jgi:CRISPR system Cascade subunit CasE